MPALTVLVWAHPLSLPGKRLGTSMCSTGPSCNDGRARPIPSDEGQAQQPTPEAPGEGVGVPNLLAIGETKVTYDVKENALLAKEK